MPLFLLVTGVRCRGNVDHGHHHPPGQVWPFGKGQFHLLNRLLLEFCISCNLCTHFPEIKLYSVHD